MWLIIVLNRGLGNYKDPEISGTSLRRVCEGGAMQAMPDPAPPDAGKSGSRGPAKMEET
jgi:hypothetical protein